MRDHIDEAYELVRVSDELFGDFAKLAQQVYGTTPSDAEMRTRFHTGDWGVSHLGYFAYCRKTREPAAFYGVLPCFVEYQGRKFLASQGSSAMTHPDHRRRDLFYKTAKKTYELAKAEGVAFSFAFPNPSSYPGFMKLGWTHDGHINSYHFIVPTLPLQYFANRAGFLETISRKLLKWVTSHWRVEYYPFPNSAADNGVATLVRDELSTRFKPESDTRMILRLNSGTSIWISVSGGRLSIGDIDLKGDKEREMRRVLRFLKFICFFSGSFILQTHLSPDSTLDALLRGLGYAPRTRVPICHFDMSSAVPIERMRYSYGDFDTF